jgi:predicted small lipoprotein YifL
MKSESRPRAVILPDRQEKPPLNVARSRRWFLTLTLVMTVSGLGAACGVKGPLYLPEEPATETEKEKKKDEEKTSQRKPVASKPSNS